MRAIVKFRNSYQDCFEFLAVGPFSFIFYDDNSGRTLVIDSRGRDKKIDGGDYKFVDLKKKIFTHNFNER